MKVLGVIPARYAATRFPGKPLADIGGKTMVQRVWESAAQAKRLDKLVVATDDQRIIDHIGKLGGEAVMTSTDHASGTDRLGEVAEALPDYGYILNIQGDEPLLEAEAIDALVEATLERKALMSTLITQFGPTVTFEQVRDTNSVKVVMDEGGYALYFSRSAIPYPRNAEFVEWFKHIGIYMYSRETLLQLCRLPRTLMEQAESLEQLRALYNGIRILTVQTTYDPVAVDVPDDVALVLDRLGLG
jgi:3-deoxy-manno-octulosonate cytidylyltransferase (CMP-KDO synthetase)